MRLFVGTFLSDDQRARIADFQSQNDAYKVSSSLRWVEPQKLHLTWCFLGEVNETLLPKITSAVGEAVKQYSKWLRTESDTGSPSPSAPLTVSFDRTEFWPDIATPRYFVLEPTTTGRQFDRLAELVRTHTAEYCDKAMAESFKPHLTIARLSGRQEFKALETISPIMLTIDKIDIIRSHTGKDTEGYQSLHAFQLPVQA